MFKNGFNVTPLILLSSFFVTSLVLANVLASKICEFWFFIFPAGTVAYCITFLCTDLITEFYGREIGNKVVLIGFLCNILMLILVTTAIHMPIASFQKTYQKIYVQVLSQSYRIVLASMIAYLVSQLHDVHAFYKFGKLTKGKYLWFRNNVSTCISQFIDTCTFTIIAFIGVVPIEALISMMLTQYTLKVIIALCDTPFCYLGRYIMRKIGMKTIWETTIH